MEGHRAVQDNGVHQPGGPAAGEDGLEDGQVGRNIAALQPQALAAIDTSLVAPGYGVAIVGGQLLFTLELAAQGLVDLRTLENAATVANVGINGQPFLLLSGNQVVIQLDNIPNPGAGQQLTYEADFASVNDPVQGVIVMRISFTIKGR